MRMPVLMLSIVVVALPAHADLDLEIQNADRVSATLLPANPSFYTLPKTVEEVVDTVVARVLDHLKIEHRLMARWQEEADY